MNFDLELFKQAIESDAKDLEEFRQLLDTSMESIEDDYLDSVQGKYEDFIDKFCNKVDNTDNLKVFISTVLVKYAYLQYLQGLKDGQTQLTLDLEKFNKSRDSYLEKKKHSKFSGTILKDIKED